MILFRSMTKEILSTTAAVTGFLLFVFISYQFMRFMMLTASGQLAINLLMKFILLQIPYLFGYLLPIGFFFGILLTLGRMYADSEMTVLRACGFGEAQLCKYTLIIGVFIAIIVTYFVLFICPRMIREQQSAMALQAETLLVQTLVPGRFQNLVDGSQVFYVENISRDRKKLNGIFVAQLQSSQGKPASWQITTAKYANQQSDAVSNTQQISAFHGYRYAGIPGQQDYSIMQFDKLSMRRPAKIKNIGFNTKATDTPQIWRGRNSDLDYAAEWQWRIAMPFMVILMVLLGVPLSRLSPRQGKYAKLLPSVLLYIVYVNMLFVGRTWIRNGTIPTWIGMWSIHGPVILFMLWLWLAKPVSQYIRNHFSFKASTV